MGRAVQLNDRPFTVIGVLPAGFRGLERGLVNDVWISLDSWSRFYGSPASLERRDGRHFEVIARLAPRATLGRAASELALLGARWATAFPDASRGSTLHAQAADGRGGTRGPARAAPRRGRPPRAGDRRRQRLDPARGPRRRPPHRDGDAAGPRREPVPHRAPGPGGVRAPRPRRRRRGPPPRRGPRPRGAGAADPEPTGDRLRRRAGPPGRWRSPPLLAGAGDARGRRRAGAARLPHRDRALAAGHGAGARPAAAPRAADRPRGAPGRARGRRAEHRGPPPGHASPRPGPRPAASTAERKVLVLELTLGDETGDLGRFSTSLESLRERALRPAGRAERDLREAAADGGLRRRREAAGRRRPAEALRARSATTRWGPATRRPSAPACGRGASSTPAEHSGTSRGGRGERGLRARVPRRGAPAVGRHVRRVRRRPRDRGRRRGRSGRAPSRGQGALRVPALRAPAVERRGPPRGDGGRARGARPRRPRSRPRGGPGRRGPRHDDARPPHGGGLARGLDAGRPRRRASPRSASSSPWPACTPPCRCSPPGGRASSGSACRSAPGRRTSCASSWVTAWP